METRNKRHSMFVSTNYSIPQPIETPIKQKNSNLNSNLNSNSRKKRNSLISYNNYPSSRLPIPINSSNDLNSLLTRPTSSSMNISSKTKRLSMIYNSDTNDFEQSKIKSAYRKSINFDSLLSPINDNHISSSNSSSNSHLPNLENLSLESQIPKSPTKTSTVSPLRVRNNNSVLSKQNIQLANQPPQLKQLKFNYYTKNPIPTSQSIGNIQPTNENITKNPSLNPKRLNNSIPSIKNIESKEKSIKKLQDIDDLFSNILNNPLLKNKFENCLLSLDDNNTNNDDKIPFYAYEELSSKRPDMFANLTMYERIMQHSQIYFTGLSKDLKIKADLKDSKHNYRFDDRNGNYIILSDDHINYKYEIKSILGKGAFGSVISTIDHSSKRKKIVACKIINNDPRWTLQAVEEIKILRQLEHPNILKYIEHFSFRSHMCIVTELLGMTLYEAIQSNGHKGFSMKLVKKFTKEILKGISYIHSKKIIHCDLKPENLMISSEGNIKIIDFGSSCYDNRLKYSYLQSRFYRAPEVLLGGRYNEKMDIWSIALISIEIYAGVPLLQPQNEWELFLQCIEYFNFPSRRYILKLKQEIEKVGAVGGEKNSLLWKVFDSNGGIDQDYFCRKMNQYSIKSTNDLNNNKDRKRVSNIDKNRMSFGNLNKSNVKLKVNPGHGSIKKFLRKHSDYNGLINSINNGNSDEIELMRFLNFIEKCLVWNKWARISAEDSLKDEFFRH